MTERRLTRRINGHPDESAFTPKFGRRCLIIGNGNVAVDVLRFLTRPPHDWQGSDLQQNLHHELLSPAPAQIAVVGRSPAGQARFDALLLRELGTIDGVAFCASALPEDSADAKVQALRELAQISPLAPRCEVRFYFGWQPKAIVGCGRVEGAHFVNPAGQQLHLPADSVISAIGFAEQPGQGLQRDALMSARSNLARGLLDDGLFCVGWFRCGARGAIPESRSEARTVSEAIIAGVESGTPACRKPGLAALPAGRLAQCTDYRGWQRIDAAEQQAASAGRVRQKITDRAQMLAIARLQSQGEQGE